jgi:hypothetical protein
MRTGVSSPSFLYLIFSHSLKVRHAYFLSQGSTVMAGFHPATYSGKLTMPLTFLRASQKDGPRAYSSSTMPPAIKSVQMMHSQLSGWLKVCGLCFFLNSRSHSVQPQRRAGYTVPGGVTIQPCPSCKQTNADKINALKRRTRDFMGQPRSSDDDVQTSYLESTDNYEYDMLAIARLIAR